jgi:hypothetical protein
MVTTTEHVTRKVERVALLTESLVLRGVLTAFGWLIPRIELKTFDPKDEAVCLDWMAEKAKFDRAEAVLLLRMLRGRVGLPT